MVLPTKLLSYLAVVSAIVVASYEASAEIVEPKEESKLLTSSTSATSHHNTMRSLRTADTSRTKVQEERSTIQENAFAKLVDGIQLFRPPPHDYPYRGAPKFAEFQKYSKTAEYAAQNAKIAKSTPFADFAPLPPKPPKTKVTKSLPVEAVAAPPSEVAIYVKANPQRPPPRNARHKPKKSLPLTTVAAYEEHGTLHGKDLKKSLKGVTINHGKNTDAGPKGKKKANRKPKV